MIKVLRAAQRPRLKGQLYETFSFLPFYGGYVKPFGDLMGIEEVIVSPGGSLHPDNQEMDFFILGRKGYFDLLGDEIDSRSLRKNCCLTMRAGAEPIGFKNGGAHGLASLLSLAFRPGEIVIAPGAEGFADHVLKGSRTEFLTLASASDDERALPLSLDAVVSLVQIGNGERFVFETEPARRVLVIVLKGTMDVDEHRLGDNDSLMVMGEPMVAFRSSAQTRMLIVDLPEYHSPTELLERNATDLKA